MRISRFEKVEGATSPAGFWLYCDGHPGPWRSERVLCRSCERVWFAVYPDLPAMLECPRCGELAGAPFHE